MRAELKADGIDPNQILADEAERCLSLNPPKNLRIGQVLS